IFRSRISLNGLAIFINCLVRKIAASVDGHLLLVHVREGVMIVGGSAVNFARRGSRGLWFGIGLRLGSLFGPGDGGHQEYNQNATDLLHAETFYSQSLLDAGHYGAGAFRIVNLGQRTAAKSDLAH